MFYIYIYREIYTHICIHICMLLSFSFFFFLMGSIIFSASPEPGPKRCPLKIIRVICPVSRRFRLLQNKLCPILSMKSESLVLEECCSEEDCR